MRWYTSKGFTVEDNIVSFDVEHVDYLGLLHKERIKKTDIIKMFSSVRARLMREGDVFAVSVSGAGVFKGVFFVS